MFREIEYRRSIQFSFVYDPVKYEKVGVGDSLDKSLVQKNIRVQA